MPSYLYGGINEIAGMVFPQTRILENRDLKVSRLPAPGACP